MGTEGPSSVVEGSDALGSLGGPSSVVEESDALGSKEAVSCSVPSPSRGHADHDGPHWRATTRTRRNWTAAWRTLAYQLHAFSWTRCGHPLFSSGHSSSNDRPCAWRCRATHGHRFQPFSRCAGPASCATLLSSPECEAFLPVCIIAKIFLLHQCRRAARPRRPALARHFANAAGLHFNRS